MTARLSRGELYELVWSEPLKTLSGRFGISDVALRKTCDRSNIPIPDRGYWAKRSAGKATFQPALPARSPGMDDEVLVAAGGNYWYREWTQEQLLGPLPPKPEFTEPIDSVRERIAKVLGKVTVPHTVGTWHPAIERLLKEDETRREKRRQAAYPASWDAPLFDTPFERRRLRIFNSLFFAAAKMNGKPLFYGHDARDVRLFFYQQHVAITLDRPKHSVRKGQSTVASSGSLESTLSLAIGDGGNAERPLVTWQDDDGAKLETKMTEIAIEAVLAAEGQYRESAIRQYQWRIERKAKLEEEERQRRIQAERAERERQKRIEQGRIDRLLQDAAAFYQAGQIRRYVEAIGSALGTDACPIPEFEHWKEWALAQADRIDPVQNKSFLRTMHVANEGNPQDG